LRGRLKLSRQVFATNLGISMSGLGYYERDRTPPIEFLLTLSEIAEEEGFADLAQRFQSHAVLLISVALQGRRVNIRNLNPKDEGGGTLVVTYPEELQPVIEAVSRRVLYALNEGLADPKALKRADDEYVKSISRSSAQSSAAKRTKAS